MERHRLGEVACWSPVGMDEPPCTRKVTFFETPKMGNGWVTMVIGLCYVLVGNVSDTGVILSLQVKKEEIQLSGGKIRKRIHAGQQSPVVGAPSIPCHQSQVFPRLSKLLVLRKAVELTLH